MKAPIDFSLARTSPSRSRSAATLLCLAVFASTSLGVTGAHSSVGAPEYTRLVHTSKTAIELQTRSVHLVPVSGTGPDVWLVSTAHIGRGDYYKSIQSLLDAQSLVLFEGVKGKEETTSAAKPEKPTASTSTTKPFAAKDRSTYRVFADSVGLDFQLYDIDYSKPNFKNCDLTWAQVEALASKEGEATKKQVSGLGQLLQGDSPTAKMLVGALGVIKQDPGSQEAMRVVLAEALSNPSLLVTYLGEATDTVIIRKRNEHVVADLKGEKGAQTIAIFYGAAHMPDMEQEIINGMDYRESEDRWFTAIQADESKITGTMGPAILAQFRQMLAKKK